MPPGWGRRCYHHAANEGVAVICPDDPEGADAANILFLVPPSGVEGMLRERLEGSQEFAAAFREAAWRSLVLGRAKIGRRMPLWITRLKSQKLFSAVKDLEDFPLIIEAWRTCLTERFDAPGLSRVLRGLAGGEIAWSVADTAMQSPLARDMVWRVVAGFMYAGDRSTVAATTRVSADLVAEAVADAGLRPVAPSEAAARLGALVRRTAPGYAPGSGEELLQYVLERLAVPLSEWNELGDAVARDHGLSLSGLEAALPGRLVRFRPPHAAPDAEALVVAAENLPRLEAALDPDEGGGPSAACLEVVAEWLRFYGPVDPGFAAETLGLDPEWGREVVSALVRDGTLVLGRLVSGGGDADVCDTANFERLLRLVRTGNAPRVPSVSMARLTPYLAAFQGLSPRGRTARELFERLRRLTCLPLPAATWEEEVLPARCEGYEPASLDEVLRHAGLVWRGGGAGRVLFVFAGDQDLLDAGTRDVAEQDGDEGRKRPTRTLRPPRPVPWTICFPIPWRPMIFPPSCAGRDCVPGRRWNDCGRRYGGAGPRTRVSRPCARGWPRISGCRNLGAVRPKGWPVPAAARRFPAPDESGWAGAGWRPGVRPCPRSDCGGGRNRRRVPVTSWSETNGTGSGPGFCSTATAWYFGNCLSGSPIRFPGAGFFGPCGSWNCRARSSPDGFSMVRRGYSSPRGRAWRFFGGFSAGGSRGRRSAAPRKGTWSG